MTNAWSSDNNLASVYSAFLRIIFADRTELLQIKSVCLAHAILCEKLRFILTHTKQKPVYFVSDCPEKLCIAASRCLPINSSCGVVAY